MKYSLVAVSFSWMTLMSSATYLGCFADTGARAMPDGPGASSGGQGTYNPQSCSQQCDGYTFFAVQYYGADCWCSNDLVAATQYGYSTDCPSGDDEGLGGGWANALFAQQKIFVGVDTLVGYDSAKDACSNGAPLVLSGGQLATFGSDVEYAKLVQIQTNIGKDTYIGLSDENSEGQWRMIDGDTSYCDDFDGTDCDNIPQWSSGEPNDSGTGEDAAEIWSNGQLNDVPKTDLNAYICEFNYFVSQYTVSATTETTPTVPMSQRPNYYVLEFTSFKDILVIFSVVLNVVLIACVCYTVLKAFSVKSAGYLQVKMNGIEDMDGLDDKL